MLFLLRFCYAPLYFIGFIGTSIFLVQDNVSFLWLVPLFIIAVSISFLAERVLPYQSVWNNSKNDITRDQLHAIVNEVSTGLAVASIPLFSMVTYQFHIWPEHWPLWLQLVFAILIADVGITLAHYLSHKVPLLWTFHAIHHSAKRMYGFNGLMKHPLHQLFELIAGTMPLLVIGMPIDIGALLGFAVAIQLTLQHSNVDMNIGPLIYIWAIAPGHRHHHIASKYRGNVNFGLFTMVWDHLLGTFIHNRPTPRDGELGIDGQPDFPIHYIPQLLKPFRR